MPSRLLALPIAFILDYVIKEPELTYHPVNLVRHLVTFMEKRIRGTRPSYEQQVDDKVLARLQKKEFINGIAEVILVCIAAFFIPLLILRIAYRIWPFLGFVLETAVCWMLLRARELRDDSMEVYQSLREGNLDEARQGLKPIWPRETAGSNAEGLTRICVEAVSEESMDGTIAPLLYMAIGGVPLMALYKAINTMDDMLGHRSGLYLYFGRAAARLDDAACFVPARIGGWLTVAAAYVMGFDGTNAKMVYQRDRRKHASPNSAQVESAMAGALNIRLGGEGKENPWIGDANRPIELEDIPRANRIALGTSLMALVLCMLVFAILH